MHEESRIYRNSHAALELKSYGKLKNVLKEGSTAESASLKTDNNIAAISLGDCAGH